MATDREQKIRERAFEIWVSEEMVDGRHQEHWLEAEKQIDKEDAELEADPRPLMPKRHAFKRVFTMPNAAPSSAPSGSPDHAQFETSRRKARLERESYERDSKTIRALRALIDSDRG